MTLSSLGLPKSGSRVLHFAPERFLYTRLSRREDISYNPFDYDPSVYTFAKDVKPFNLCSDLSGVDTESADLIIHNHVLEHLPCDVDSVFAQFKRVLRVGAYMTFSVPFGGRETIEDLDPRLSASERKKRFAQADHMRIFGTSDFGDILNRCLGSNCQLSQFVSFDDSDLRNAGIPLKSTSEISGHSVFVYQKIPS